MNWPPRFRTVLAQITLRVIAPLAFVLFGVIASSLYAYQQIVTSLLIDRDRQLATLSAARVSEAVEGYARTLEALATTPELRSRSATAQVASLESAAGVLQFFNAGVALVDREGLVLANTPRTTLPVGETVAGRSYFQSVRQQVKPVLSNVVLHAQNGQSMFVIAVPILDDQKSFTGALLGAVYLKSTPLGDIVQELAIGAGGFAYVVDGEGRVIFHPEPENIGADFTDRPFVKNVMAGESGGILWPVESGELFVSGYAPIRNTGWGLIVREPWDSVVAPIQLYSAVTAIVALVGVGVSAYLLWHGVRRIVVPLRLLAQQSARLAAGEKITPGVESPILEIDALERDFSRMADQIESYRAGLRHYVGALTRSQEEERRRLVRELHDETMQSLLAITRRLELHQASEGDLKQKARLEDLQSMVADTLSGLRQISRDLRPLALEDLGLIPALRTLVRATGEGSIPHARLEVSGPIVDLSADQDLALYRITQEALTNVHKHARATGVRVDLTFVNGVVKLDIVDDGQGFEVPHSLNELAQRGNFGLMGIQERVWAVGGTLSVNSRSGGGTRVSVTLLVNE